MNIYLPGGPISRPPKIKCNTRMHLSVDFDQADQSTPKVVPSATDAGRENSGWKKKRQPSAKEMDFDPRTLYRRIRVKNKGSIESQLVKDCKREQSN